jgi:chromate transporter
VGAYNDDHSSVPTPTLRDVVRQWGRIGCLGFGGPPTHIALLRDLCVERNGWLAPSDFEDAIAACNLLPGPASTQLAIFCAWRVRGRPGAIAGGLAFILPGLGVILGLAALFLAGSPPLWVKGASAGAGAAVAAVAVHAGRGLLSGSRLGGQNANVPRRIAYLVLGGVAAATVGAWLVLVLLGSGIAELIGQRRTRPGTRMPAIAPFPFFATAVTGGGALASIVWVAFKVGALSYGGGFVIVPLMQSDAVSHYHWMTNPQFLNAVALGQITPGPVVLTVAVVGYAAAGVGGALLAVAVAFVPSFAFVLFGARHFDRIRGNLRARSFLDGAGPAAIGAIFGSAIPLAFALTEPWQYAVLAGAAVLLILLRRGVVPTLILAGSVGVVVALAGAPLPH